MASIYGVASLAVIFLTACPATAALAETVQVTLSDHGAKADMPNGLGMGISGADMSKSPMVIIAQPATVKAGKVTFVVTSKSKDLVHEMILAPLANAEKPLPYKTQDEAVDEDALGSLGEVAERDPGKDGTLTIDLKPGKYVLFCNVPKHYMAGMWTTLTVEPGS